MKERLGPCEVCWQKPAKHVCRLCGRRVCDEHYDFLKGICSICASSLCQICSERLALTFCPVCGRLVCYEDSVQLDNVRRVCRDCYMKGYRTARDLPSEGKYIEGALRLARRVLRLEPR